MFIYPDWQCMPRVSGRGWWRYQNHVMTLYFWVSVHIRWDNVALDAFWMGSLYDYMIFQNANESSYDLAAWRTHYWIAAKGWHGLTRASTRDMQSLLALHPMHYKEGDTNFHNIAIQALDLSAWCWHIRYIDGRLCWQVNFLTSLRRQMCRKMAVWSFDRLGMRRGASTEFDIFWSQFTRILNKLAFDFASIL